MRAAAVKSGGGGLATAAIQTIISSKVCKDNNNNNNDNDNDKSNPKPKSKSPPPPPPPPSMTQQVTGNNNKDNSSK